MKVYVVFERQTGVEWDALSDLVDIFKKEEDAKEYTNKQNQEYYEEDYNELEETKFYYKEWRVE